MGIWERMASVACVVGLVLAGAPAFGAEPEAGASCVGKVRMHGPIWDLTAQRLEPGLDVVLDTIARAIRERCGGKSILIESHAYELATPELNQRLSELRAAIIRQELVQRGVPAVQLMPIGLGDTRPLLPLDQAGAALENRRITFRVLD